MSAVGQEATMAQMILPTIEEIHHEGFGGVVDTGLRVLGAMLEADRTRLCGPRYEHDVGRAMTRAGDAPGELAMGGRRVAVRRPRVRPKDGQEVDRSTWRHLAGEDPRTWPRGRADARRRRDPQVRPLARARPGHGAHA